MGTEPIYKRTTGAARVNGKRALRCALGAAIGLAILLGARLPARLALAEPAQGSAWRGEYYAGRDLIGAPVVVREDRDPDGTPGINFDWGREAPAAGLPADEFSARWTRRQVFEAGLYRFEAAADDGVRLFVDGELVIEAWQREGGPQEKAAERRLEAGSHTLRVEYFEAAGAATIRVRWETASKALSDTRSIDLSGLVDEAQPDDEGWQVAYYDNPDLRGAPAVERTHQGVDGTPGLNLDWGARGPALGLPADDFSVRWTRTVSFDPGVYRFRASVDDGMRVWVDETLVIDEWRDGTQREVVAEQALAAGEHALRVEYYDRGGLAAARLHWEPVTPAARDDPAWKGAYWDNPEQAGPADLLREESLIAFEWGQGAPAPALPGDNFSARWTRTLDLDAGSYRFYLLVDDGVRLQVDEETLVDGWSNLGLDWIQAERALDAGLHTIQIDYRERLGDARIHLAWERIAPASFAGWKGEYWPNRFLRGEPAVVRDDPDLGEEDPGFAFDWGTGMPALDLPVDGFSARWTRSLAFEGGRYTFYALADDGIRAWVDGQPLIDRWSDQGAARFAAEAKLAPGEHALQVEYYEQAGRARVRFGWEREED